MTQDDQQPERAPGGPISRDTLLLLGALTFLILAVALTFLFTPGSTPTDDIAASQTAVAEATMAAAASPGAYPAPTDEPILGGEPGAYPSPDASAPPSVAPTAEATVVGAYPGPGAVPSPDLIPTGDASLEPSPTQAVAGGQQPTVAPSPTGASGYPGPIGEGTPPPRRRSA